MKPEFSSNSRHIKGIAIMRAVRVDEFDYELPQELIAQFPAQQRTSSRLLVLDGRTGAVEDRRFSELRDYLRAGDVIVLNDTRVIKARLHGRKDTGGKVEALVQRIVAPRVALVMIRASHAPKPGQRIWFDESTGARIEGRDAELYSLVFDEDVVSVLDRIGHMPLPPYIERHAEPVDSERYQTVFARVPGAVAAPTAGLHFDEDMIASLQEAGIRIAHITLHVGAGTFQPVRADNVEEHVMHSEWYRVGAEAVAQMASARAAGRRIVAIGTTSLRALESAAQSGELKAGEGDTRLFIRPGYRFVAVDALLTNFHLPRSTLLMLVSAFAGAQNIRRAYRHAIEQRYRFFSYGDAMFMTRAGVGD